MRIAIGETKVIKGKRYRKEAAFVAGSCHRCHFYRAGGCALNGNPNEATEQGGSECYGTIWILADDQPDAPTATPPRDEGREQRRFEAAVAAMQGMLSDESGGAGQTWVAESCAERACRFADALLAELDRTGAGK